MSLLGRTFPAPLHVDIAAGALERLGAVVADPAVQSGERVAVVVSARSGDGLPRRILSAVPTAEVFRVEDGLRDTADELVAQLAGFHSVIGAGGGRVLDVSKYAATRADLPMIAVPTNLAHDGIASPVSILEHEGRRTSNGVQVPAAVVIDLEIIRRGPRRFVEAGLGDVLSNLSAVADWELAREVNGEEVDGLAAAMARTAATCLLHQPGTFTDDEYLVTLAEALVLSGLAMAVAGTSRPCSGACHEVSHAIDMLFPQHSAPHGEQVGVGALFATHLRGDLVTFAQMRATLLRHGLPTLPSDLGLTDEMFAQAVEFAPRTRPDRFTLLEHLALDSVAAQAAVSAYVQAR